MRMGPTSPLPRFVALGLGLCVVMAGCGGSSRSGSHAAGSPSRSVATRVCDHAEQAATPLLSAGTSVHIASSDPANLECLVSGDGVRLDIVAQASPRAWAQYDTETVHQAQAFGGAGQETRLPRDLPGLGFNAAWFASQSELVATNGTQSRGGSYVTVTVTRTSTRGSNPSSLKLAKAVTIATLAVAPRGANPGPAPP